MSGQQNFNVAGQVLAPGGFRWRLGMEAGAVTEQTGGDDAGIIQDEKFVAPEKVGKLGEDAVFDFAGFAAEGEESGEIALGEGALGDQLGREGVVEFIEAHRIEPV